MKGRNKAVTFQGAGTGNITGSSTPATGTTMILNASGGSAIKAFGSGTTAKYVIGLVLRDLYIKNTANIGASTYTIDWDFCTTGCGIYNVVVTSGGLTDVFTGNGFQYRNMLKGQSTFENITIRRFTTGTSYRIASETTANGTGLNSGNVTFNSCTGEDTTTGWDLTGPDNLLNGITLNSCKAVNTSDIASSIGFHIRSNVHACTLNAPHAERFSTGYKLNSCRHVTINSPLANFPTGTPDASSAGVRFSASAFGNIVNAARITQLHYGASFEDTSRANWVSGADSSGSRVLTSFFNDTSFDRCNVRLYQDVTIANLILSKHIVTTGQSTTGGRPSASTAGNGAQWYDTDLHKPIWSDGTSWRDAAGTVV